MEKAPRQSRLSLRLLRGILFLEAFCLAVVILVIFGIFILLAELLRKEK